MTNGAKLMPNFTPIQTKMLAVLSDGRDHANMELFACLNDELGSLSNVRVHVSALRKKLQPIGQDIVCVYSNGRYQYRHVRLLASKYDE